jgi:hypothetical protein
MVDPLITTVSYALIESMAVKYLQSLLAPAMELLTGIITVLDLY